MRRPQPRPTLFPYTTLFRSDWATPGRRFTCIRLRMHPIRSEEHTSELQSRGHLVCRLLLEKKNRAIALSCVNPKPTAAYLQTMEENITTIDPILPYIPFETT